MYDLFTIRFHHQFHFNTFFFLSHVWINNSLFSIRIEISGKNVLILETQQNDQKSVGVINVKPENASIFFEYNPIYGFVWNERKKGKKNELVAFVLVDVAVKHIELILCKRF